MALASVKTRRFKFWWHLTIAYIGRYQLRIVSAILGFLIFIFLAFQLSPLIFRNNTLIIGYVGTYGVDTLPTEVLNLATRPLITKDETGKSIPDIASHWTVSEDGRTYIVFLKDSLHWHDDSIVEASDISLAISNVQITALNNKAIEFKLPNPIASFPQALDTPVFKRKSFYGIGNYRITDLNQLESVVKKITLVPQDKNLPKVEIKFYPSEDIALKALKLGEIKTLSATNAKNLENWPNLNINKEVDYSEIVTVFYNNANPTLGSKEFRQALSYAVSKNNLDGEATNSPVSKKSWAYNENTKKYEFNQARAKELLSKAEIKDPKITLSYLVGLEKMAEQIKTDWENVGIKVDLKEEKTTPKEFQALLAINKLPADPDQYSLWHSTQKATNISKYDSKKIDKLLEDARATQKENERKDLYFDFQQYLAEDAPAAFLYHPYKYKITYKNAQELLSKLPTF